MRKIYTTAAVGAMIGALAAPTYAATTEANTNQSHPSAFSTVEEFSPLEGVSTEFVSVLNEMDESDRDNFIHHRLLSKVVTKHSNVRFVDGAEKQEMKRLAGFLDSEIASCWEATATSEGKALLGNVLFRVYHTGGWCGNSSHTRSASVIATDGQAVGLGWRYDGEKKRDAAVTGNRGVSYSRHLFILGSGPWDAQKADECLGISGKGGKAMSHSRCSAH